MADHPDMLLRNREALGEEIARAVHPLGRGIEGQAVVIPFGDNRVWFHRMMMNGGRVIGDVDLHRARVPDIRDLCQHGGGFNQVCLFPVDLRRSLKLGRGLVRDRFPLFIFHPDHTCCGPRLLVAACDHVGEVLAVVNHTAVGERRQLLTNDQASGVFALRRINLRPVRRRINFHHARCSFGGGGIESRHRSLGNGAFDREGPNLVGEVVVGGIIGFPCDFESSIDAIDLCANELGYCGRSDVIHAMAAAALKARRTVCLRSGILN